MSAFTAAILTEGCKVNRYESEAIAEALEKAGFTIRPSHEDCDLYVINTCTVTAASDKTARQTVRGLIKRHPGAYVILTGCSVQAHADELSAIPGVDALVGNRHKLDVITAALSLTAQGRKTGTPIVSVPPLDGCAFEPMTITRFDRIRPDVKIEDGCACRCTYCAIPDARGPVRSKLPDDVLREVAGLCEAGCREVVLTGIETGSWGADLDPGPNGERQTLGTLLSAVNDLPGICRVRLGSLDPSVMTEEFVGRIAGLACLAPHFHLSVQSGCSRTLARMRRRYNADQALAALERLRRAIPGVQFTTDMIVGFPGETEADFEETLDFARRVRFLKIHVFPYSRRKNTPAAAMPDQIPPDMKADRAARLSALSDETGGLLLDERLAAGLPADVLFERFHGDFVTGHTPEFMEVKVRSSVNIRGREQTVRLTGREGDLLLGELI